MARNAFKDIVPALLLASTLTISKGVGKIRFGLSSRDPVHASVWQSYWLPFKQIAQRIQARIRPGV